MVGGGPVNREVRLYSLMPRMTSKAALPMARRILIATVLICAVGALRFSTFGSLSVCTHCGCRLSATDFQLPLVPVTYWRQQKIEATPLSIVARDLGLVKPHAHDWDLIQGGGNGIRCALGQGGELSRALRSPQVTQFLLDTSRYRGRDEANRWFGTALDFRQSRAMSEWIQIQLYPADGFAAATDYDHWRTEADLKWPEFVEWNSAR
ncbi:MAG: hypothetical protein U0795_16580 [Pirellulales bacterium]